ncbi:pentatricopeptide repeat-containing protein At3g24000, mitochondrial-like [Phalaenopsis equestris]|uniref:pentatricopeptide repeat-containing protein At3g24000, mitochondrial-like n=1 Tax=Phalaenopsis equestris TaxID=78828 RepID=UPI0009E3E180|nr:pentatricopeptide repeat-containing protein At3g24000, mitochondrial-like [Phalaenopsis equestris]
MPATAAAVPDPARLHAQLIKSSSATTSSASARFQYNQLISLYSRSPSPIPDALHLFHRLPVTPNSASWTSAISSLSGDPLSAASLFLSMLRRPSLPTQSTISSLLKILSSSSLHLPLGLQLHSLSLKLSLSSLPFSASSLISFYSKHRLPTHALKAFDEIVHPDHVCFSAIIAALAHNHRSAQSLSFFHQMHCRGLPSTIYSISSAVRAAADSASLDQTRIFHSHSVVSGLHPNPIVGTALLAAYGKSGVVPDARRSFDELHFAGKANLVSWNALLSTYAQQGDAACAQQLFDEMLRRDLLPDDYTFLAILAAYSNSGMVEETERWLNAMRALYSVEPKLEHYSCLLGAMARAGRLDEAERFAHAMPFEPDAAVWRTILSACMAHRNADVGRRAAARLLELDPRDDSAYVMLAKIYSFLGRKEEMAKLWMGMRDQGVRKEGGRSWIEVAGGVHVFIAGDRRHERSSEIYGKVRELERETGKLGYEEKGGEGVWEHSERLAVAMGLLGGGGGTAAEGRPALRVIKNLRICGDCHEFFKYVSRAVGMEIVVRDVNRYHRFYEGVCSCKDCW